MGSVADLNERCLTESLLDQNIQEVVVKLWFVPGMEYNLSVGSHNQHIFGASISDWEFDVFLFIAYLLQQEDIVASAYVRT